MPQLRSAKDLVYLLNLVVGVINQGRELIMAHKERCVVHTIRYGIQ